jgi:peptide-methionine (R)-S-oxide reductase
MLAMEVGSRPPSVDAVTDTQKASIAELHQRKKYALYELITPENRLNYFRISTYPITKKAEDDMELLSDIVSWGEMYRHMYDVGTYHCARCDHTLYSSADKWDGPCVWPSFRKAACVDDNNVSLLSDVVFPYNKYTLEVRELYCARCQLFVGHAFEDGIAKGDRHPEARWRH